MDKAIFSVGDILEAGSGRYRIITIISSKVVLVAMDTEKLEFSMRDAAEIAELLGIGKLEKGQEEEVVFNLDDLTRNQRAEYDMRLSLVKDVAEAFGPDYLGLAGKAKKPDVPCLIDKYGISKGKFWRIIRRWLQGGLKNSALLDYRFIHTNEGKTYTYKKVPGRKAKNASDSIPLNDEHRANMDEALREYMSSREKTLVGVYRDMIYKHYSEVRVVNGNEAYLPKPASECLSLKQFYRYAEKVLDKEAVRKAKTSATEVRNDARLLIGGPNMRGYGPGFLIEIDACESNIILVSKRNNGRIVGRPTVYFMVDVFSGAIIAVSVDFHVNSPIGLTNLFLNLAEDKTEFAKKYGVKIPDPALWPSNILPTQVRMDRGADMKSKELTRICTELGIEHELVSGGSGSLKGKVEKTMGLLQDEFKAHFEGHGLIDGRHDTDPYKDATLDVDEYMMLVILFILDHNQNDFARSYRRTKDMKEKGIKAIPAILWEYGTDLYGQPRPISDIRWYLNAVMTEKKAKFNREGVLYEGLLYWPDDDPVLEKEMFEAGRTLQPIDIRTDDRCVSTVWYKHKRGKRLFTAHLKNIDGNAEYADYSMEEWKESQEEDKKMIAESREYNDARKAVTHATYDKLMKTFEKDTPTIKTGRKEARREERRLLDSEKRIADRMPPEEGALPDKSPEALPDKAPRKHYTSMLDVMDDRENNA